MNELIAPKRLADGPEGLRRHARILTEVPGPRSRTLVAAEAEHLAPGTQQIAQLAGIAVDHGEGAVITDVDGNAYLDFVAGIGVASIGHGHAAVARAIAAQAGRITAGSFPSEPRRLLVERLAGMAPLGGKARVQLYSGGAEAVESALRLARAVTKKFEIVSFWGGFHGKTAGVLALMGSTFKHGLGPQAPGAHLAPYADCYRCPLKTSYPGCGLACVETLRDVIKLNTTGSVAAVLVEPMQGTAGNIIPPPDWLPAVAQVARETGALLIADEMITGFGRTGKDFAVQHTGVVPDLVTFGKGVAAGFPLSGLLVRADLVDGDRADPWSRPSFSSSSYGGLPLGAAAGEAVTRVVVEEKLAERAAHVGALVLSALSPLVERHPVVGEVRGSGLLLGLELVQSKASRAPLDKQSCEWIFRECLRRGLLTMSYSPRVRINPPLVIDAEQALEGVAILDEVLTDYVARWPRA